MTSDHAIAAGHVTVRAINGARRYRFDRDVFMTLMRVQRRRAFRRLRDTPCELDTNRLRPSGSVKGMP
jgi:hypothetical protein